MDYIKELVEQLSFLIRNENMKVNVHFIIPEPLNSFCVEINQKIQNYNSGFIHMGINSIILPHISLFMGFVDSYQMLELLFSCVHEYAQRQSIFSVEPTKMYFKGRSQADPQYLFIDLLQNNYLMKQKQILNDILKDKILPIGWDMKDEPSHITVGCYKKVTEKIQNVVDEYPIIPPCIISQIGISVSGKRGVSLGLLKVFQLSGK